MAKKIAVDHVRDDFIKQIESARKLVNSVHALPRKSPKAPGIHPTHVQQVAELAFMGLVASWEEFLERTLVRYIANATTGNGYQPTAKVGYVNTLSDGYIVLSQNPSYDPAKHYLKVTEYKWVVKTASFLFSAHPYGCITNNLQLLKNAVAIRNRVAHASEKCRQDFVATAKEFKSANPQAAVLPQGFTPGKLLFEHVQRIFPQPDIQAQLTHFEAYARLYTKLASQIVP